jgi:type I restriction enzyme, S subunit
MSEWTKASIGDFFDLIPGYAFKSADFTNVGVPVIKIKNIKAGYFSEHEFSYVSPQFIGGRSDKLARPGDLLISMSGNRHDGSPETWVGKIAIFQKTDRFFINQRVGALRRKAGAKIDIRFASFLLSSIPYQELFIAIATSSGGQANLSPQQILSAPLAHPDLKTQIGIGEMLGALDDKIDLNRHMNETLEAMARAIFRDWFVEFGPTRAKLEGRARYFAPEIWSVFPERIDHEEKPIGWRIEPLDQIAEFLNGLALQKYPATGDLSLPVIKIAQLRSGNVYKQ